MTIITTPPSVPDLLGTSPADLTYQRDLPQSTATEAHERAARIRDGLDSYTAMRQDIADAYSAQDWLALEYGSWPEYVMAEFGPELQRLARGERRQAVQDLRSQGLSTRQIAKATGTSQSTIRDDLKVSGNHSPAAEVSGSRTPEGPERVTGADGKSYPATKPVKPESPVDQHSRADRPVVADPGKATEGVAGQDPRPATPLVDTPIGPITQKVADALDKHVPNPDPHAEWRLGYLKRIHAVHAVMRSKPEDVAEMADETCLDELARCVEALTEYRRSVVRAVMAGTPDNVTPLRRSS